MVNTTTYTLATPTATYDLPNSSRERRNKDGSGKYSLFEVFDQVIGNSDGLVFDLGGGGMYVDQGAELCQNSFSYLLSFTLSSVTNSNVPSGDDTIACFIRAAEMQSEAPLFDRDSSYTRKWRWSQHLTRDAKLRFLLVPETGFGDREMMELTTALLPNNRYSTLLSYDDVSKTVVVVLYKDLVPVDGGMMTLKEPLCVSSDNIILGAMEFNSDSGSRENVRGTYHEVVFWDDSVYKPVTSAYDVYTM